MHRHAVAHRTGHQLLSVSIAFQCLRWMVDCISNHKIIHSLCAVMQDCCCKSCIISYFCVAPIFNDVVPRSVPQFPNSSPEMHLSSLSTVLMLSLRLAKKGIESMLLRCLKRHWLLNELRRCCRRAFIVMKICFHFFSPAQALRRKWPIMLAAILGLFFDFPLSDFVFSSCAESPSEIRLMVVFMCQRVYLTESERDGERVLVCLIALVGVSHWHFLSFF